MIVTLFPTVREATGTRFSAPFGDIANRICTPHYPVADKLQAWAYSPFEFVDDTRGKGAWARCHFGVIDCDDLTDSQLAEVLATRERLGLQAILYSTYSHSKARASKQLRCLQCSRLYAGVPEQQPLCKNVRCRSSRYTLTGCSGFWRLRLVVPFSRAVDIGEWATFHAHWRTVWKHLDPSDHAKGHLYTVPSVPFGDPEQPILLRWPGVDYDVDAALAIAPAVRGEAPKPHMASITLDTLMAVCRKQKKSKETWVIDAAVRAEKALKLEPFAETGDRDNQLWKIAKVIAYPLSNVSANAIAEHFRPAIEGLGPGAPTEAQFIDKLERAQAEALAEQATTEEQHTQDALHRARVHAAFESQERFTGYTEQEFSRFTQLEQCDAATFQHRWVIQYGSSFYFYHKGSYTDPYPLVSARNATLRDLAPAAPRISLFETNALGEVARKPLDKLVEDYGTVAQRCEVDMTAQRSHYDAPRFTMVEASCPLATNLTPLFNAHVDTWLRKLGGAKADFLNQWIAHVTDLSRPFVALIFTGAPAAGKSLLANGLAPLFGAKEPTTMKQAFGQYNQALMSCPLVFADEQLPKDSRGRVQTTELREFIQARIRPLTRKYLPDALLVGAVRVIIAANNPSILAFPEILDSNDIRAITERFFHIAVSKDTSDYLAFIGVEECERWVKEGVIARHALWLKQNLASHKLATRFGLTDPDGDFARALMTRTGDRALLLRFCAQYCLTPQPAESLGRTLRTLAGRLLVSLQGVERMWPTYMPNEHIPTTNRVAMALQGISHDLAMNVIGDDGKAQTYRSVDLDILRAWVKDTDFATPETLLAVLVEDTEIRAARNKNVVPIIRAVK